MVSNNVKKKFITFCYADKAAEWYCDWWMSERDRV